MNYSAKNHSVAAREQTANVIVKTGSVFLALGSATFILQKDMWKGNASTHVTVRLVAGLFVH